MLTLQIVTEKGKSRRITVQQAEFVNTCPYCREEFITINPDQVFCRTSHRVNACLVRKYERSVPHVVAAASIGMSRAMAHASL